MDQETKEAIHNIHIILKDIGKRLHDIEDRVNKDICPTLNELYCFQSE